MKRLINLAFALLAITAVVASVSAQSNPPTETQLAEAGKASEAANELMDQRKYSS